jgi:hypothetical protein
MQNDKQGWNAEKLAEEASQKDGDEIQRQMKRGDETKGDADERDDAGTVHKNDTAQGREEVKTKIEESRKNND